MSNYEFWCDYFRAQKHPLQILLTKHLSLLFCRKNLSSIDSFDQYSREFLIRSCTDFVKKKIKKNNSKQLVGWTINCLDFPGTPIGWEILWRITVIMTGCSGAALILTALNVIATTVKTPGPSYYLAQVGNVRWKLKLCGGFFAIMVCLWVHSL